MTKGQKGLNSTPGMDKKFFLLALLMLFGCGVTPRTNDPLNGTKWVLQSLNGYPLVYGTTITMEFSEGYVRGSSGCNQYSGRGYQVSDDGILTFPHFGSTIALCSPEEVMKQEETYVKALGSVTTYRLTESRLELQNKAGDTIFMFANQNISGLPYLAGAFLAGGMVIYSGWVLLKKRRRLFIDAGTEIV